MLVSLLSVCSSACSRCSACTRKSTANKKLGTDSGSGTTAPASGAAAASSPDFGSLTNVCGPNKTGKTLTATDRGVTADSIKVTTVSDPGFVGRPGLNQELFDASTVFTKWCNSLGGINGRKIIDNQRDAALVNFKAKVLEACQSDFSMVGGGAVFDDTGQQARLNCLLPDLPGYVVSPQARGADLLVQAIPNALDNLNIGASRWVTANFPGTTSSVGYLTANVPSTVVVQKQFQEAGAQIGWKTVYSQQYNANGETTWVPFAQSMKSKNVQGLVFVGEPANLAKLEQAFQSLSYYPKWISVSANFYDKQFITLGGGALKNTYVQVLNVPFFDAGAVAGHDQVPVALPDVPAEGQGAGRARRRLVLGVAALRPGRRRSAGRTSRASACTTTPRPSRPGTAAGSRPPATPPSRRRRSATRWCRPRPRASSPST